jgi:hypothetical protein
LNNLIRPGAKVFVTLENESDNVSTFEEVYKTFERGLPTWPVDTQATGIAGAHGLDEQQIVDLGAGDMLASTPKRKYADKHVGIIAFEHDELWKPPNQMKLIDADCFDDISSAHSKLARIILNDYQTIVYIKPVPLQY